MRLLSANREDEYVKDLIYKGMGVFLDTHVLRFSQYQNVPVHFVGSIAHYFKESLNRACVERGIEMGEIVKKPIEKLVEYHRELINLV
jgi:hypothetical protein